MPRLSIAAPTILLAVAAAATGCSGGTPSKAGGDTPPVTLTIGTDDPEGRASGAMIAEFARQVAKLSDGSIVIEPVWRAAGENQTDWDQKVGRMVRAGDLDLGMIPARAWDTEGVTSFRALHAPLLVDSNALVDAVVADDVAAEMLGGLDKLGLNGLALVPESLRHPFSFAEPVLEPGDLKAKAIRTPRSDVSYATLTSLEARPAEMAGPGEDFAASVADGSVTAAESSFDFAQHLPQTSVGTANLTLYPKVQSLVANANTFSDLSTRQRAALEKAAVETRTWAINEIPKDRQAATEFCAGGGRSVLAPQTSLNTWATMTESVYETLEKDPTTAKMIDTIRDLKKAIAVGADERPLACGTDGAATTAPSAVPAGENVIPEGTYRRDNTLEALMAGGLPEKFAKEYVGVLTFTLAHGVYTETPPPGATFPPCVGSYSSTATHLEILFETHCSGKLTATWATGPTGLLLSRLVDTVNPAASGGAEAIFGGGRPFTKID